MTVYLSLVSYWTQVVLAIVTVGLIFFVATSIPCWIFIAVCNRLERKENLIDATEPENPLIAPEFKKYARPPHEDRLDAMRYAMQEGRLHVANGGIDWAKLSDLDKVAREESK